jgi:predicted small lipoprotein YifL
MVRPHFEDIAVNRSTSPASPKWAALVLFAVALALAGCGRKGALDLPSNAAMQPTAAAGTVDAEAVSKGNLFDPSYGMNGAPVAPKGKKRPFILDPLLD